MLIVRTLDDLAQVQMAVRDILFLYRDAILGASGFVHNLDTGTFDPFRYLTCVISEEAEDYNTDIDLLHEGSAVALLCHLSDFLDEDRGDEIEYIEQNCSRLCTSSGDNYQIMIAKIRKALDDGLFDQVPLAREAVAAAFQEDEALFREKLADVYRTYIVGYFQRLFSNV